MEALGINVPGLIAQVVNFALLLVLFFLWGYRPLVRMLDERSRRIRESMERAEELRRQTEQTQLEIQARLEQGRQEGQNIVAQAAQIGERLKEEARQNARREAEALLARARSEIQAERDEAIAQLRRQFADLAILAAERVIHRALDRDSHRQLIEEVLAEEADLRQR